ncbi:potassium channel family protein [Nocardiopsis quinghaiensis]|uniref:potassium channel family protein n=1 Tax=Nocardiopsis quinghaiensis TaxID=464995 RepID=UPI00123917B6|nr:potassium channel family protein [Nocardiopsis quinghaiensis]
MVFVSILGLLFSVLVTCDAVATVLHSDSEGLLAGRIRKVVWRTAAFASARLPRAARRMLSLVGPVVLVATFVTWIALLTLGLALTVWPMLEEDFSAQPGLKPVGFPEALYFAGGTVPVLGYGDITPQSTGGQLVSLFGAAVGFALFTGMATYAIQVTSGVSKRNRFTLSVHDDARGRGGVTVFAESLAQDGLDEARTRCRSWAESLREVEETVHRYPLVALTYRSRREEYDPEPALRHVAEAAVAALVASGREPALRASAESLCRALVRLQRTIARTYLGKDVVRRLARPQPTEYDRRAVDTVDRMLTARLDSLLGADHGLGREHAGEHDRAVGTVHLCQVFLEGLHEWACTDAPPQEWETR